MNYTGNVVSRRNHSDSEGEKHHPKSKRRKMDPPDHKKRRLVFDYLVFFSCVCVCGIFLSNGRGLGVNFSRSRYFYCTKGTKLNVFVCRSHSQEEFDEAEVFSKSEIRKFIKSFRKFGPAAKRLKEIGRDAGLSASVTELDALLDILHTKISEAEAYATNIDGKRSSDL